MSKPTVTTPWRLTLVLTDPHSEVRQRAAVNLDELTMREHFVINAPREQSTLEIAIGMPKMGPLTEGDVAEVVKRREYRRALFLAYCKDMGRLLAETMEAREGWREYDAKQ